LKDACEQGELPTLDAIHKTKIPYLDAFLEEMTRLSHTSMSNGRITTQDVEVLGYHIPKGIEVWLMVSRHSFAFSNNSHTDACP
jgi:cytochrome P450